jgi:hypothetical protein
MNVSGKRQKRNPIIEQIKGRKWQWIGHSLREDSQAAERQVLYWSPQGRRRKGSPKRTWRSTVEEETGKVGQTWKEAGALAQNRNGWRCFVEAL